MRTGGEHGRSLTVDERAQEALVVDALVDRDVFAAPGVVSGEAGFVARLARDVAAGEKEVANGVRVGVCGDCAAGRLDGFDRGVGRKHREIVERGQEPALIGSIGVNVDDEWGETRALTRLGNRGYDGSDAAGMVPVPVRKEQHLDAGQVER